MKLGDWIEELEALPPDAVVQFDDGTYPDHLCSWRGRYAELTLDTFMGGDKFAPRRVSDLLANAREAVGKTFEGYKGGDFTMDQSTTVWADPYGEYRGWIIIGVEMGRGDLVDRVIVKKFNIMDYLGW